MLVIILLALASRCFASMEMCDETNSVDISKGAHLSNGDVYFNGIKFDKSEYFLDNNDTEMGCFCKKEKCIRKCCPFGLMYNQDTKKCVNTSAVFEPPVFNMYNRFLPTAKATKMFHFITGVHNCTTHEGRVRVTKLTVTHHLRECLQTEREQLSTKYSVGGSCSSIEMEDTAASLLKSWGTPEDVMENFRNNDIQIENFKDLNEMYLKELCPHIGHRMKLKNNIQDLLDSFAETETADSSINSKPWQNDNNVLNVNDMPLDDVSLPNLSFDIDSLLNKESRPPLPEFDIKTLLQTSAHGNSILSYYQTYKVLNSKKRNELVEIIIKHIYTFTVNNNLKPEDYNLLAAKIIALFPTESISSYYMKAIPTSKSCTGKYIPAKGKLVDKVRNLLYISQAKRRTSKLNTDEEKENLESAERNENIPGSSDDALWLNSNSEPWDEVLKRWENTFVERQQSKLLTVYEYLQKWKILKHEKGHLLIDMDFERLYKEQSLNFYKYWESFFVKLLKLKQSELTNENSLQILETLNAVSDNDKKIPLQMTLLGYLVPPKGRLSRKIKFSSSEAIEELIVQTHDGKLYVELPLQIPAWSVIGPEKYCIDTFVTEGQDPHLDALACFSENVESGTSYLISSTCMLISCVFILATVAVYSWLPELRNLHGRVLMACLLSFFIGFLFMATMQILLYVNQIQGSTCLVLTFIIYYFLLAAFFWLNVMCFDIWWTFSSPSGHQGRTPLSRFTRYAIYAFGVPSLLTIIMAGFEFSGIPANPWMPNIKHMGCFLYGRSKLLYLYGPITILCVANLIFFVLTAKGIAQTRRQTQNRLRGTESTTNERDNQQRLMLYVKLFVVMGINWLLEVISALYPDATCIWQYTDAYNVLIGLIVFIIFVCKRKIFRLLKNRYRQMRGDPISRTATTSSRSISTRDDMQMGSVKATEKNGANNNTHNNTQV